MSRYPLVYKHATVSYSTSMIPHAGRPTTRTSSLGPSLTNPYVYPSSTPWLSLARLKMRELRLILDEARLLISQPNLPRPMSLHGGQPAAALQVSLLLAMQWVV